MFADLQRAIVNYLKSKPLVQQHGIHVWTNADGDLDAMIQSQLNAIEPLAIVVMDIAPERVADCADWLSMSLDVSLRLVEKVALNQTPVHAIDLIFPILQWLHGWTPGDIDGFNGVLVAVPEQPVVDEDTEPGAVQKLFRFRAAAEAETDHSTQYNA